MNKIILAFRQILAIILVVAGIASCEKIEPLTVYELGTATTLSASSTTLAPVVADSLKTAVSLSWSNPKYSVDSSTVKYTIQIDSAGKNFARAVERVVNGTRSISFISKDINEIALSFGIAFNKQGTLDVRVISSHANNNERLNSNVVKIAYTPYVTPPKVTPPTSNQLFLVGSATAGGWNNPVPVPSQQFTRIDNVTYEGQFYLKGGQQFLCLPVNGDWSNKYSVKDNNVNGLNKGGDFGFNLSDNFPGPDKTGIYKMRLDFQSGKFTMTLVQEFGLLYVAGDYQGWSPATAPQIASPTKDGRHDGYVFVPQGGSYEFKLTSQADWGGTNYGYAGPGALSSSGGNLKFPGDGGYFRIVANVTNSTFTITPIKWTIIGSLTGWGSDIDMTFDSQSKIWKGTATIGGREEFKFRANNDWPINLGDNDADNSLEYGGANIVLPSAGTYEISLDLNNPGYYTYKVKKQ